MNLFDSAVFFAYFEGEGGAEGNNNPPAGDGNGTPPGGGDPPKTFTQDELNNILAAERKRNDEKTKKHIADLEKLQKSKSLTENEKSQLQAKIDELNNTLLTKEELAAKERKKLAEEHSKEVANLTKDRDTWKDRFTTTSILRTIGDAANEEGAFNSNQIVALLQPITQLREETDAEGNPTGKYIPRVAYPDMDKDGKQVTLDLTIPEAVKRMKETPERYGNLFKSTMTGGTGSMPTNGAPGTADITKMTPEQYFKHRKSLGLGRVPTPQLK